MLEIHGLTKRYEDVLALDDASFNLGCLGWVSPLFFWIALAAWAVVFVGMVASLLPSKTAPPG